MILLTETRPREDIARLDDAWAAPESFAFLPARGAHSRAWVEQAVAQLPAALARDHFALLTSGSTGRPKLVVGRKARADALARALHDLQDLDACAATVLALPLPYCFAFVNQWRWARALGRRLTPTAGFAEPDALRTALADARDAMLCLVGAQMPLLEGLAGAAAYPGVTRVNFAGGRFPQEKLGRLRDLVPAARVFNNYGCAEAMPRLALRDAGAADEAAIIGPPLPGVRLRAVDAQRLEFQSPYGAVGFVTDDGFRAVSDDDWIPTGDLAEPLPGGAWRLLGREGEVFKRYGEKIALPDLLAAARAVHPGEAAAFRERDPAGEEGYVLVLAPAPAPAAVRAVLGVFRDRFPRTHWPLRIEARDDLPRLANGKIDTPALKSTPGPVLWKQHL
ncbi:MAG: class I adenylate-forming enzyme family protein [Kiritimatiellia bacterium]